jgi:hypothetical protein
VVNAIELVVFAANDLAAPVGDLYTIGFYVELMLFLYSTI